LSRLGAPITPFPKQFRFALGELADPGSRGFGQRDQGLGAEQIFLAACPPEPVPPTEISR